MECDEMTKTRIRRHRPLARLLMLLGAAFVGFAPVQAQLGSVVPHVATEVNSAEPAKQRVKPRYGGTGSGKSSNAGTADGKELKSLLDIGPDPKDPHTQGFEPRPGPEEGGDKWAFGVSHAAIHHVLESSVIGNATTVVKALDEFAAQHRASFSLGPLHGSILESAVRKRVEEEAVAEGPGGVNLLVLNAGLGGATLRCITGLLQSGQPSRVYEVVSVEDDHHLSDGSRRLVDHALGRESDRQVELDVRHTPLIPGEDTVLPEVLESLMDGYELRGFDVVVLAGNRTEHQRQLETLFEQGALRHGAILHSSGPPRGDAETERYIEFLQQSGGHFDYEVHEVASASAASPMSTSAAEGSSSSVITATLKKSHQGAEL